MKEEYLVTWSRNHEDEFTANTDHSVSVYVVDNDYKDILIEVAELQKLQAAQRLDQIGDPEEFGIFDIKVSKVVKEF